MVLTGTDAQTERPYKSLHVRIVSALVSSGGIFYSPARHEKILRTYHLILRKFHLIVPKNFCLPTWENKNSPVEIFDFLGEYRKSWGKWSKKEANISLLQMSKLSPTSIKTRLLLYLCSASFSWDCCIKANRCVAFGIRLRSDTSRLRQNWGAVRVSWRVCAILYYCCPVKVFLRG